MRVVLDTSVWVSALLWLGLPHRLLKLTEAGAIHLCMTPPMIKELQKVLARPKFAPVLAKRHTTVPELIAGVLAQVELYSDPPLSGIVPDNPDDDAVIACAVVAQTQWIVTGDEHLLRLGTYQGICIGNPRDFLLAKFPEKL